MDDGQWTKDIGCREQLGEKGNEKERRTAKRIMGSRAPDAFC